MNKRILTISALILIGIALIDWWVFRPKRTTAAFVDHVSQERYEEAAQMLTPPSAIEVTSGGGLTLVDHAGTSTTVQQEKLPFLSGGGETDGPGDFSMTALQGGKKGRVDVPVVLYLGITGGKIRIDRVDTF
ncbi:MAG: hypothetical protein P1U85_13520 [Verrucomicrobiales bacterium]|jgi:hypothetical protein|nr:hypothetical protein [Verrucomicrobiales bacterium]